MPMRRAFHLVVLQALATLGSLAAGAATFDARGIFAFDKRAVYTIGFDGGDEVTGVVYKEDETALQGKGYARVTSSGYRSSDIPVKLPAAKARYRAAMWARNNRVVADISVEYLGQTGAGSPSHAARFFPTGRVTSDGWYEVATAPFTVDGTRKHETVLSLYASGADLDGLEFVEEGTFREAAVCQGRSTSTCGDGEFCAGGYCRNGNEGVPALPNEDDRVHLANYLAWRLKAFFGGRLTRENTMPQALSSLQTMKTATSGWAYWNGYATAIHRLRDWHTTISGPVEVAGRGAFPFCVDEAVADASRAQAPSTAGLLDVIITAAGPEGNSGLKVGDRIVAIDGRHPIQWAESFDDLYWGDWRADDPDAHAEGLERLRFMVRRWATELTVIRCDSATGVCGPLERLAVKDLPTAEPSVYPVCDHRPFYHFVTGGPDPVTHYPSRSDQGISLGPISENVQSESIYTMVWYSVMMDNPDDNPYAAPMTTLRGNASAVILDHRTGNGGTEPAAEFLTQLFRRPAILGVSSGFNGTVGFFDAPYTAAHGQALVSRLHDSDDAFAVGANDARDTMRTAVLLARDGSASDWWPEGMKNGGANIRLFGRRTAGAFSSFFQFDYFGGMSWQFASGEYVRPDGTTHIGEGVRPDEDISPTQSDLLAGRDTVYLRALDWVRTGL